MNCTTLKSKEPMALAHKMDSYFKKTPPDCSLFSKENFQIPIHKELLYQTSYMRSMVKSLNMDSSSFDLVEVICPSMSKRDLENMVQFLYSGKISCCDKNSAALLCENLASIFGFPSMEIDMKSKTLTTVERKANPEKELALQKSSILDFELKHVKSNEENIKEEIHNSDDSLVSTCLYYFCMIDISK